jgi:LysR family transcriptional regulator (chromosome initiation inhibitor)
MTELQLAHLRALRCAVDEGTLEAAARVLHVTPSAVSQRLKSLENAAGRMLFVRSNPIRPTPAGVALLRLARQVEALGADALREARGGAATDLPALPLAISADALATWVLPALSPLAEAMTFHIHREDEDHTARLLLDGTVMAAITTQARPMPGCTATRLGVMAYRPFAAPAFAARRFPRGPTATALAQAPMVVFDDHDALQHAYLRSRSRTPLAPPIHHVPSSAEYLTAVRLGWGWGMLPDLQSPAYEAGGELVRIDPRARAGVVLHWQQWRLRSTALDRVGAAIVEAARTHLQRR